MPSLGDSRHTLAHPVLFTRTRQSSFELQDSSPATRQYIEANNEWTIVLISAISYQSSTESKRIEAIYPSNLESNKRWARIHKAEVQLRKKKSDCWLLN